MTQEPEDGLSEMWMKLDTIHSMIVVVFNLVFDRSRSLTINYHIIITTELNEPNELLELSDDDDVIEY